MTIIVAGLLALYVAVDAEDSRAMWTARFGVAAARADETARFAAAEAVRWKGQPLYSSIGEHDPGS
jgi:hypothetical protein